MGVITYNGKESIQYGIRVETPPGYQSPELDVEFQHIPGRNGDIPISTGSYKNVTRDYVINSASEQLTFDEIKTRVLTWLYKTDYVVTEEELDIYGANVSAVKDPAQNYCKLEDTYDTDHYRLAMPNGSLNAENILGHGFKTTLSFTCRPERYLMSGSEWITVFEGRHGSIIPQWVFNNTTNNTACPVYYVEEDSDKSTSSNCYILLTYPKLYKYDLPPSMGGQGETVLGTTRFDLKKGFGKIYIVSDDMSALYQGTNMSSYLDVIDTSSIINFPYLPPGRCTMSFGDGLSLVKVKPNWYDI